MALAYAETQGPMGVEVRIQKHRLAHVYSWKVFKIFGFFYLYICVCLHMSMHACLWGPEENIASTWSWSSRCMWAAQHERWWLNSGPLRAVSTLNHSAISPAPRWFILNKGPTLSIGKVGNKSVGQRDNQREEREAWGSAYMYLVWESAPSGSTIRAKAIELLEDTWDIPMTLHVVMRSQTWNQKWATDYQEI